MPASTDSSYLDTLVDITIKLAKEGALEHLNNQFPDLNTELITKDINWAKQLRQRGYSKREILDDIHLS